MRKLIIYSFVCYPLISMAHLNQTDLNEGSSYKKRQAEIEIKKADALFEDITKLLNKDNPNSTDKEALEQDILERTQMLVLALQDILGLSEDELLKQFKEKYPEAEE